MAMTASRTSSMMLMSASGLRRVSEVPVLQLRVLVQDRRLGRRGRHDVRNLRARDDQRIDLQIDADYAIPVGDEFAVAGWRRSGGSGSSSADGSVGQIACRFPVIASTRRTDLLGCRTTRFMLVVRACSWAVSRNRTPAASQKVMWLKSRTICWMPASSRSSARWAASAEAMSSSPISRTVAQLFPLWLVSARKPGASAGAHPPPSMPPPLGEAQRQNQLRVSRWRVAPVGLGL